MNPIFVSILNRILGIEGGYVNDARDSGGATRYGITEAVARAHGYRGLMRSLPIEMAREIYRVSYWEPVKGDTLANYSEALAHEVFDSAVNCGVGTASKWLQRSLNVLNAQGTHWADIAVDGKIGPATLRSLKALRSRRGTRGISVLVKMLDSLQGQYYISLAERRAKDETFVFGWFDHRIS